MRSQCPTCGHLLTIREHILNRCHQCSTPKKSRLSLKESSLRSIQKNFDDLLTAEFAKRKLEPAR